MEFAGTQLHICRGGATTLGTQLWSDLTGTTAVSLGKWYHAALVRDGLKIYLYLNGKLEGSSAARGTDPGSQLLLGIFSDKAINYAFQGSLGRAQAYNRALAAAEIRDIFMKEAAIYGVPVG